MKMIKIAALVSTLVLTATANAGDITVSNSASSSAISTSVLNNYGLVSSMTFDFSNTHTSDGSYTVIDGSPFSVNAPFGSASFFTSQPYLFGFNFTGFNAGNAFSFSWDPDSAINGSYGATGNPDFVGAVVTAVTGSGVLKGTIAYDGRDLVVATLAPVPEPETYAMLLAGLGILGATARRQRSKAKA
jgi:hypothetical protein